MMIVPNFWAEARTQYRSKGKQITIRRFGWSDASQEDAQNNAQARADEALKRAVSGEPLPRRERKVPYNGADGLPIREEVVARHGETVITRNSYGARCLNTPDVLFADIDFPEGSGSRAVFWACALFLFGASAVVIYLLAAALTGRGMLWAAAAIGAMLALSFASSMANALHRREVRAKGGPEAIARAIFCASWKRAPTGGSTSTARSTGLRLLATHRLFDPLEAEVTECFKALATDPVYMAMCLNQHCFQGARVGQTVARGH
ncbi:hypothetical protein LP420_12790 [Massilia sp. B-10]|nr:hypothetical protein LP420_12790 [Massilia sp. B-10]